MTDWHDQMAAAVNARKLAQNGVDRWVKKRVAAEAEIAQLSAARPTEHHAAHTPAQVAEEIHQHVPQGLAPVFVPDSVADSEA